MIPEANLSTSSSNIKLLTTFVGRRGELVSDIRIGKRSTQGCYNGGLGMKHDFYRTGLGSLDRCCRMCLEAAEDRSDWRPISHISLGWNCHCYHGPYDDTCQRDRNRWWQSAACSRL